MQTDPIASRALSTYTIAARSSKALPPSQPERAAKDAVVISREALAQSRTAPAQSVRKSDPTSQPVVREKVSNASTGPVQAKATSQPEIRTFGQQDLEAINKSFGARIGGDNYSAGADADGNGVVDFKDITHVLGNWGKPR